MGQDFIKKNKTLNFIISNIMNEIYLGSILIIFSVLKMLGVSFHFFFSKTFHVIVCIYYIILDLIAL